MVEWEHRPGVESQRTAPLFLLLILQENKSKFRKAGRTKRQCCVFSEVSKCLV